MKLLSQIVKTDSCRAVRETRSQPALPEGVNLELECGRTTMEVAYVFDCILKFLDKFQLHIYLIRFHKFELIIFQLLIIFHQ